jgi:hypothetical protein
MGKRGGSYAKMNTEIQKSKVTLQKVVSLTHPSPSEAIATNLFSAGLMRL